MSDWFTDEKMEKAAIAIGDERGCRITHADFKLPYTENSVMGCAVRDARAALRAVNPYEWRSIVGSDIPEFERFRVWNGAGQFIAWMEDGVWVEAISGYDNPIKPTPTHFCALFFPSPEGDK